MLNAVVDGHGFLQSKTSRILVKFHLVIVTFMYVVKPCVVFFLYANKYVVNGTTNYANLVALLECRWSSGQTNYYES